MVIDSEELLEEPEEDPSSPSTTLCMGRDFIAKRKKYQVNSTIKSECTQKSSSMNDFVKYGETRTIKMRIRV